MSTVVSNVSGDRNDKIANAAKVLEKSKERREVFRAIYSGGKVKPVEDIMKRSGIKNNVRVLQHAKKLVAEDMVKLTKKNGRNLYEKLDFYTHNKSKILQLAANPKSLKKYPTKINPNIQSQSIKLSFPKNRVAYKELTVDDIDSFSKAKKVKISTAISKPLPESKIKTGFQKIVGEKGTFTDWGGEINDLFTSRVIFNGKRISTAIAFKGKATKGVLTLKKLGKNADQVQRLFKSAARLFIIQYQGPIDQSVLEEMKTHAIAKSFNEGDKIYYSVIDGQDTSRLLQAYRNQFK